MNYLKEKLERIESLLLSQKEIFNLNDFCQYTGLSESAVYDLTSKKKIQHSKPNGKIIFFDRKKVDEFLLSNPISTIEQIEHEAAQFSVNNSSKISNR